MATLENDYLKVTIRPKGAELTSIFNKITKTEHLWQGNPDVWGWHAPNLFPVVGECLNNQLQVNGKNFPMERHGFARHSEFEVIDTTATHAKFSLGYDENTQAVYPYKFEFQVLYDLFDNELRASYKVINQDSQTFYFSLGAHPAFNVPFYSFGNEAYTDYYLEFENGEKLEKHLLSSSGYFNGDTEPIELRNNKLPLTKELFAKDALVFKRLLSRKINIKSKNHPKYVSVSYPHFDYLGIWAKPGAPFVCIEPWLGCADTEGKEVDIKDKEGIHKLEHGHVFEAEITIGIN